MITVTPITLPAVKKLVIQPSFRPKGPFKIHAHNELSIHEVEVFFNQMKVPIFVIIEGV